MPKIQAGIGIKKKPNCDIGEQVIKLKIKAFTAPLAPNDV